MSNLSQDGHRPLRWLKRHGHHLFFGLSLVSLGLLLAWWTIFIKRAVQQEYSLRISNLTFEGEVFAVLLGHDHSHEPEIGPLRKDNRFEVVENADLQGTSALRLLPHWGDYAIRPKPEYLEDIEDQFQRRIFMVVGEGSFLGLLMLVSSFMLYRIIWLERRSVMELHEFWGRITHEIKTPITGLKTFLQTLMTHKLSREELKPLVELALRQVERQEQLAHNILIGQRIGDNTIGLQPVTVHLPDFVRKFVKNHGLNLANKEVKVHFACGENLTVKADPDALYVILDNLMDNAIKYGGEDLHLEIDVEADESGAFVTFTDNGPGIDPRMVKNVFEAYRRLTDELPEGSHGTGMGLFISRKLARRMGGELEAYSEGRGRGTRFRLSLQRFEK